MNSALMNGTTDGAFTIFSGTSNSALAGAIARILCVPLGERTIERFPDGEVAIWIGESVRRKEVFIVQPTSPPVDSHLVELLAFADACRRAAAAHITAVIPYFGYARSDKRHGHREPITACMVADLLQAVGVNQVITVDLHAAQIEGFFHVPVDNLTAVPTLCAVLHEGLSPGTVVVSPDVGRVKTATEYAHRLGTELIVLHKQRESGTATEVAHVVGDVRDRPCLVIDDMISTGGTMAGSIAALLDAGARPDITIAATRRGCRGRFRPPASWLQRAWPR
jgi:ribose-phosphate pyrophosphokinase